MKRTDDWNNEVENPKIDEFLTEVCAVCKRHGFSIPNPAERGGFTVRHYRPEDIKELMEAGDGTISFDEMARSKGWNL